MPNTRISDLTAATSVAGTDVYPSVQTAGVGPVKTSLTQITAFALANAPAGALATPSIAPTGDTNTGFWFPAADTIAASTGGSERMRINSSGNVGIGTTLSAWGSQVALQMGGGSAGGISLVGGNQELGANYYITSGGNYTYTANAASTLYSMFGGQHRWFTAASGTAGNTITFSEAMRITSAGNVGIGTASPGGDANNRQLTLTGSTTAQVTLNNSANNFNFGINGSSVGYAEVTGANPLVFLTNGTERMRITSAGNLLIGTTSSPTTGTQCLTIETETAPTATPADTVTFYSSDLSAGNTIPSIYTEGTGIVSANTGTTNLSNRIAVRINGTVYYLLAASSA